MAFRPNLLVLATALVGFAAPVNAAGLSAINAFSCAGQGNGYSSAASRQNWTPEYYNRTAATAPRGETASTVKLRIIYEMGDRVEIDHCGGTVIDSNWVVTAGHCVAADLSWDRIEIIAGDDHLDGAHTVKRTTREAVCHAGFRYQTLENDIALVRVENPFPARIRPTELDFESAPSVQRGSVGMGHGWPVTGMRAGDRFLNRTPLRVHDVDMSSYITVTNAASTQGGLCRGESGGPILSNSRYGTRLAGVLSGIQPGTENHRGDECMLGGYEMYFTPIAAHRRWIDNVKALCTGNPAACGGSTGTQPGMAYASAAPITSQYPPAYQTAQLSVPKITYAEPAQATYVNIGTVGNVWGASVQMQPAPAAVYHQPTPTYIHTGHSYGAMAPIYDDHRAHHSLAPLYSGINVAYAQPVITYGSVFPHHAQ